MNSETTIKFLFRPEDTFELCAIGKGDRTKLTASGWFNANAPIDPEQVAAYRNIYVTLNPTTAALQGRSSSRLKEGIARTADKDIPVLRNMLLDFDPVRPSDTASSDEEHQAALDLATNVKECLTSQGWPEPLFADSGNGASLIYPLPELANIPENVELIKNCIAALADSFDTDIIKIDRSVFNPARLVRLLGTINKKGDSIPKRPHRLSSIISAPENRIPVPIEQIKELAAQVQIKKEKETYESTSRNGWLDVEKYLAHYGIEMVKTKRNGSSMLYCLKECIFDPSHAPNEAAIVQSDSGALGYQCFHNSCNGRTWQEARSIISGTDNLKKFINDTSERKRVIEDNEVIVTDKKIIQTIPFPFHIFPEKIKIFIYRVSESFGIQPELTASLVLAIISGAIGNTVRVSVKAGYEIILFLWLMIIGRSGYGKSPVMNYLMGPIESKQARDSARYEEALRVYMRELKKAKDSPGIDITEEKPKAIHKLVSDITVEALADVFHGDPRGVIGHHDELASFMLGMDQYRAKGNDLQHYLSLFYGKSWKIDRKSRSSFIPNTGLALIGGIQSEILPRIFETTTIKNGMFPRFLTLNVEERPSRFDRNGINAQGLNFWDSLISQCYEIPLEQDEQGFVSPHLLILDDGALDIWIKFHDEFALLIPYMSNRFGPFCEKLKGYYSIKFIGLLHVLKCLDQGIPYNHMKIESDTVNGAVELTRYFAGQALLTLNLYDESGRLTEFQLKLIKTLHCLQSEVKNGHLLFSKIVEAFNIDLPEVLKHKPEKVAGLLKELGLRTEKGGHNIVYLVWESDRIKNLFSQITITSITTITKNTHDTHDTHDRVIDVTDVIVESQEKILEDEEVLTVSELSS